MSVVLMNDAGQKFSCHFYATFTPGGKQQWSNISSVNE